MIIELKTRHGVLLRMNLWTFLFAYTNQQDIPILYRKDFKLLVDGKRIPRPKLLPYES